MHLSASHEERFSVELVTYACTYTFFMYIYVCMYVCTYIFIHIRVRVVIFVWKCKIRANPTPVLHLHFQAICDIAKRLLKIRMKEKGQRNDIQCVRIVEMNDT